MSRQFSKTRINNPVLIASIPYSDLVINGSKSEVLSKKFDRGALQRALLIINRTDVTLSSLGFYLEDSLAPGLNSAPITTFSAPGPTMTTYATSEQFPELAGHVDSCLLTLSIGATSPTYGTIDVYLMEIF